MVPMSRTKAAAITLASLDLSTSHGYRSKATGPLSGMRATWVEPRFRAALGRDYMLAEEVVGRATAGALRGFLCAQGRRTLENVEGLRSSALLAIINAWWPLQEMPGLGEDRGFEVAA